MTSLCRSSRLKIFGRKNAIFNHSLKWCNSYRNGSISSKHPKTMVSQPDTRFLEKKKFSPWRLLLNNSKWPLDIFKKSKRPLPPPKISPNIDGRQPLAILNHKYFLERSSAPFLNNSHGTVFVMVRITLWSKFSFENCSKWNFIILMAPYEVFLLAIFFSIF